MYNSDTILRKLIQQLKSYYNSETEGVTVIIGAGCSLRSSSDDISTEGIVKDIVKKHLKEDQDLPDTWTELYSLFVNNVWTGQGEQDRIDLLAPYFKNLEPSKGYLAIRNLIKTGYIKNIITTNFDPLIDEILKDIPHRTFIDGLKKESFSDDNFSINFVKAHGDLQHGNLRFAPDELRRLSPEIEAVIHSLTKGIVIVVGYRGQDIGIMNALNTSKAHCAFWVSPEKPDLYDQYSNGSIDTWMKTRNSEYNFINGEKGDFNVLFPFIESKLQEVPKQEIKSLKLWKKSSLYNIISTSERASIVFSNLLKIEDEILKEYIWTVKEPYFCVDSTTLLSILITVLQDKLHFQNDITNEIEALLLATALTIFSQIQGYPICVDQYIYIIKEKYRYLQNIPQPDDNFWSILKELLAEKEIIEKEKFFEISITVDSTKLFYYVLKKGMFSKMQSLFILIQQILLFQKTTCEKKDIISTSHRIKLILENYCKEIKYSSTSTKIFFENMTPQDDNVLEGYFRNIMKAQTRELVGKSRTYYIKPDIYIYYEVDLENNRLTSLYDEFYNRANTLTEEFLSAVQFNNFILPDTVEILKRFIVSDNSGLIITGVSGSGKTTALAHWIKNLQASDEYLILPFSGKNQLTKNGLQSFSDWLSEPLKLQEINELFCCRKKTLLLVYDAINEIPNTFDFLQNIYNQLICFVEKLSTHKYNNIKMILSLRKDVYMQLNDNHAVEPREGIFFPTILPNREISLTYEISPFSKNQAVKFLMDSTNQSQEVITTLYDEFSGILQMPIYIKLFADAFTSFSNLNENNFGELISRWYKILLQKISENNTHQDELVVVINEIILSKYQYIDENVYIKNIAKRLNLEEKIIIKDVNLFAEAGILTYKRVTKEINFSHDVYEQIFLTQYLMKIEYPEDFCCNILEKQINMHILSLALKDYLLFQKELNQEYYFETLIKFISKNHSLLNNCIIENALLLNENSSIENHWSILFQKIDYNIGLNCHKYILQLILDILNTRIDKHSFFSNSTLNELRPLVIQPTYIMNSQKDQAFFEFINAKYWYTFSYKFENDVLKDAQIYCINAKKLLLSSDSNISLCDDINFLYAILLRYEGKLVEAVNTLQKVLQNQIKFSVPDKICKTALELGAIYRELTKFDDALGLYKSIKKLYRDFPPYWDTRLQLNMGIIYKNKQQVKSVNYKLTKDDFNDFKNTQQLFFNVYKYACSTDDVLLKLEILAELIELCALARHYDIERTKEARQYLNEMEENLKKYPAPLRQIQFFRMQARVELLEMKYAESLISLRQGYQLSIKYNIPYRACDCCRKFTDIVLKYFVEDKSLLNEALNYTDFAIKYYKTLGKEDHVYFKESLDQRKILIELI